MSRPGEGQPHLRPRQNKAHPDDHQAKMYARMDRRIERHKWLAPLRYAFLALFVICSVVSTVSHCR